MESNWINTIFSMPFLIGAVFTIMGLIMYYFPPKKINGLYGYRTGSSMASQEKWDFSQKYSAAMMAKCGSGMMLIGILLMIFPQEKFIETAIGVAGAIAACIVLLTQTERAIIKRFGK
ncbi:SdpI family protein [Flavobacterium sp. DG1-102-2]|uniref:SdpI family protein n=1 Tax=Flavobacterium sp. DG1-102-2 TaxID=3081663 RepID=UPI002948E54E|nr:SdpI family protein [Flavobacterium sp. DG1-102-2]MDV6169957.1 SdpI family protein [Flavobacterium sp. DG1-102-2]